MGHPPRIPVWLRWEQNVIYFVTICVANRKPVLANDTAFSALNTAVAKLQGVDRVGGNSYARPSSRHRFAERSRNKSWKFFGALKPWIRQVLGQCWKWQTG